MIWARRRQFSGEEKNCFPARYCPEKMSHNRYSAMTRPSPVGVTLPDTSACAFRGRQLVKLGVALGGTTGSMKDDGSTGANSPERFRSAVTTCATFWLS